MKRHEERRADVLVIGGGMAGFSSALRVAKEKSCLMIAEGTGATSLTSGSIMVARGRGDSKVEQTFTRAMVELSSSNPLHPYKFIPSAEVTRIIHETLSPLLKNGITYRGDPPSNFSILSFCGTPIVGAYHPVTTLPIDEQILFRRRIALLFPATFPSCYGEYLRQKVLTLLERSGIEVRSIIAASYNSTELSCSMKRGGRINEDSILKSCSAKVVKESDLLFFITMGDEFGIRFEEIRGELSGRMGVELFEGTGALPSSAGLRLAIAIRKTLKMNGIERLEAKALSFNSRNSRIESIRIRLSSGEEIEVYGRSFILGTGKFTGGGLQRFGDDRENLFGLPLYVSNRSIPYSGRPGEPSPLLFDEHPFMKTGLLINESFSPIDSSGDILYENLFACGSILGGGDWLEQGAGLGFALLTGYKAAEGAIAS